MSDTSRPRVVSYVVALLSAAIAILLKTSLNSLVPNSSPYLLGLAPVMVAAWYGGLGPGILATIIVAFAGNYLYAEPRWSFLLGAPGEALHFLLFLVEGILISALSAMLHRSRRSAERKVEEARMHEETLRQSEERFRIAAGCASDLTYEIDLRTGIIEWFGDIDGRLGYAPGKFPRTAEARLEMIYPDDRPMVREAMDRYLADRHPFEMEYRVIRADGTLLRWTDRARATWDAGGAPLKWIGVNTDITERKQAEESLTESESRYRNLVETSPDAIVLLDDRFVITMANERTARLHGYATAAEMIGMEARAFVAVMPWEHAVEKIDQALAEPTDRGEELFLQRKDGSSFPAEIRASAIRGSDGAPHGYIAVVTDVTERRIIEKRLREQTEVVETVNSIGRLLSAELDQQRLVQALTDAATELTGAQFGSFFYNVQDESGEWYMMYAISGVGPEMFAHFPMPRNTDIFGPTFRGDGVLRFDDVRKDPRYGRNSPYYGMPPGHLPVVSYLAVPVVSRMGEVFGGLFFGHSEPGMFTERQEQIITGLAAQAAIAIDNARLFEDARRERANAEASERHYRILTEAIPSIVWTALPDGRLDYFNQQWATYSGMTAETTLGWGWVSALHPDDVQYSRDLWSQAVETGGNFEIEYRFRRAPDGAYRWHLGRAIPVRDEHGDILRWFGTCADIDDQKRAQETLKFLAEASTILGSGNESHDALRHVASMAIPIIADWCVIDLADPKSGNISRIAVANADAAGVELGYRLLRDFPPSPDDSIGVAYVVRAGAPEFYNDISDDDLRAMSTGPEHFEMLRRLGLTSGMCLPLLARGRAIGSIALFYSDSGRRYSDEEIVLAQDLARRIAFSVDNAMLHRAAQEEITERRRAEVELRVAKEAAEEANRAKDHFLAVLSHELRTPLTPVLASVQALEGEDGVPEDLRPLIQIIHRNVELEARLIDDLLDLTRIERGKLQLNLETADANALVRNVLDICAADITAKHLNLSVDIAAARHHLSGDTARLQQVFWNLIKNAVKFTPEGGDIAVMTTNDQAGAFVLRVSDSGIGISEDLLPKIFNAFEQGERNINHRFGGLGLGLAISRTLVDLHSGHIEAASDGEGAGATFTVVLPTISLEVPAAPDADAGSPQAIRVLLVEDHRDTREVMRMFLEQRGYQVRVAENMEAAIRQAAMPFDLLISDIGLPDGSGLDLIRTLALRGPVTGIAVSGYGMEEDIRRSIEAGFAEHLTKPVKPARLEEAIRALTR